MLQSTHHAELTELSQCGAAVEIENIMTSSNEQNCKLNKVTCGHWPVEIEKGPFYHEGFTLNLNQIVCSIPQHTPEFIHNLDVSLNINDEDGEVESSGVKTWRLVLTGGPCGGKTTAQNRLATFFESLGWRVFRVPETATILLNGGVRHCVRTAGPRVFSQHFSCLDQLRPPD